MAVHIWRKIHEFEEIELEHVRTNDVILVHINVEFSADMTLLAYDLFAFGHGQHNHLLLKCEPGEQSIHATLSARLRFYSSVAPEAARRLHAL
jgi:hypothetical protein